MPSIKNRKADLRRIYQKTFEISLIISLVVVIAAFKFSPHSSNIKVLKETPPELITVEDIINTIQRPDIPPPPKSPQIIVATVDDATDDPILNDIDVVNPIPLPDKPPTHTIVDLSDEPYIDFAEELPSPVGGIKTLQEKVHYTEIARRIGQEGTVYIQAKIDKNGDVVDAKVIKSLGAGLDEEALNAVKSTKFNPGKQRGKPVNVKMIIPIKFVLK